MTGNGRDPDHIPPDDDKIVPFPHRTAQDTRPQREPVINLPPVTKYLILAFVVIHVIAAVLLEPAQTYELYNLFGFVPGAYTGKAAFTVWALAAPVTYIFLHGSWIHLAINSFMLMAFGAGVERLMGGRRMLIFFILCGVASAFIHFLVDPFSTAPVVGASGSLSGLFAAVLVMMQRSGMTPSGRYGLWPLIILWVVVSIAFGVTGAPGGGTVAWAAHIGGFLAGFVLLKPVMKLRA